MVHIHTSYNKVGRRRCQGSMRSGFRLTPKRLSVQRLRAKLYLVFFRLLASWKSSYGNAFDSLKRSLSRNHGKVKKKDGNNNSTSSGRNLVMAGKDVTLNMYYYRYYKSFGRSNSFYSEAIADCLEFIKRTSVSSEEDDNKED